MAQITVKGTAFSTDAVSGDVYFRTDLNLWCVYDGTRWLSANEYMLDDVSFSVSADETSRFYKTRSDYALWFTRYEFSTFVDTTNDANSYWHIEIASYNNARDAATLIEDPISTVSDSPDIYVPHNGTITTQNPANYGIVRLNFDKEGATATPGNMTVHMSLFYRLIVT